MKKNVFDNKFTIGIIGGGQLGRMFIQEALNYNLNVYVLDNDPHSPCRKIATEFIQGDIRDFDSVYQFGKDKDIVTVEIENINVDALEKLVSEGVTVFPQPHILKIIKDKGLQKQFYKKNDVPSSSFFLVEENENIPESKLPFVQKLRTGGYDGQGVRVFRKKEDLTYLFDAPSIIEEFVPFVKELSVIVARNNRGETKTYPTVECEFNDANLVEFLFSPADIDEKTEKKAQAIAVDIIDKLGMVGILAVEMFLLENGEILVNEIAPRPHNSGHHTIECNATSQFEQHLRSICNLSLGSTELIRKGAMVNLLGEQGFKGDTKLIGFEEILSIPSVHLHLYGKKQTKPNRKMGHVTITGKEMNEIKKRAKLVKSKVRIIS